MTSITIATGRPASGKTTLLKELKDSMDSRVNYIDLDRPGAKSLGYYMSPSYYEDYIVDSLFLNTSSVQSLINDVTKYILKSGFVNSPKDKKNPSLTFRIYQFNDDIEQCLINDELSDRLDSRKASKTIKQAEYDIDLDKLYTNNPNISFEVIPVEVYKPTEWELFFLKHQCYLDYKIDDDGKEILPNWVNKRYLTSDTWRTGKTHWGYASEEVWHPDDDEVPKFEKLENLLLQIPNLSYRDSLEIQKLVEVIDYYERDYYSTETIKYLCVDGEVLYNKLKEIINK
jgi:hypothetical protein